MLFLFFHNFHKRLYVEYRHNIFLFSLFSFCASPAPGSRVDVLGMLLIDRKFAWLAVSFRCLYAAIAAGTVDVVAVIVAAIVVFAVVYVIEISLCFLRYCFR